MFAASFLKTKKIAYKSINRKWITKLSRKLTTILLPYIWRIMQLLNVVREAFFNIRNAADEKILNTRAVNIYNATESHI